MEGGVNNVLSWRLLLRGPSAPYPGDVQNASTLCMPNAIATHSVILGELNLRGGMVDREAQDIFSG